MLLMSRANAGWVAILTLRRFCHRFHTRQPDTLCKSSMALAQSIPQHKVLLFHKCTALKHCIRRLPGLQLRSSEMRTRCSQRHLAHQAATCLAARWQGLSQQSSKHPIAWMRQSSTQLMRLKERRQHPKLTRTWRDGHLHNCESHSQPSTDPNL